VNWIAHHEHIYQRRQAVESYATPAVRRLALSIADGRLIPHARLAELAERLQRSLEVTAVFGFTEARREIKAMREQNGEPPLRATLAFAVPDAGHQGIAARLGIDGIRKLIGRRAKYSGELIGAATLGAAEAARMAGAEDIVVAEAALTAAARGLHLHVLELVGETLNLGRTAGALSFGNPPEYAMRSEMLDKQTCDACTRVHGEIAIVDSANYYALLPPSYCFGGGRCRGVVVFEDQISNVRMPEIETAA